MNNLWVYGCSFTVGQSMIPENNQYYQAKKRYSKLLSKELNFTEKNLSECGASNFYIYRNVLKNLKYIKTNDIVIIQWTSPYRFELSTRKDEVYFPLPNTNYTSPHISEPAEDDSLARRSYSKINPLIEEYKELNENFIAHSFNEKWLLESSYNLQFTLYHTLENLGIKHIHLFGWDSIATDLVKLDKFLDRSFIEGYSKQMSPRESNSPRHPNIEENFNLKTRLMNKIIDLNYSEHQNG